jgi:hypothetical protein
MRKFAFAAIAALCLAFAACDEDKSLGAGKSGGSPGAPLPASPLAITTTTLPPGQEGVSYLASIDAVGGTQTGYVWTLASGSLPSGLSVSSPGTPATTLSGLPTVYGTFQFQIQVEDSSANLATMHFTLDVYPPPAPVPPQPPAPPQPPIPPGPPTPTSSFYGVPAGGDLVFVVEVSATMAGAAITNLRAELTSCISGLTAIDAFDIVAFNDTMTGGYTALWGTQLPATQANQAAAIAWVNSAVTNPAGAADQSTYTVLRDSYASIYPYIDRHFFYTYTKPTSSSQILADYPSWASPYNYPQVVIAKTPAAAYWGQDLAALAGGVFVP